MPASKRPKYACSSDTLYHYGEPDCPLQQDDFAEAMRLVAAEAREEAPVSFASQDKHDIAFREGLEAMETCANECLKLWSKNNQNVEDTLADILERVTKERAVENTVIADTFEWFAAVLESGDYNTLAI